MLTIHLIGVRSFEDSFPIYLKLETVKVEKFSAGLASDKLTCEGRVSVLSRAWKNKQGTMFVQEKPFRCACVMSECMWLLLKSRGGRKFHVHTCQRACK